MSADSIVVCLTSHNRVDCARINQEIVKLNYARPLPVVHASSSASYPGYMEDAFVTCAPKALHAGAINLLQSVVRLAHERFPDADYLVHLESDTWLLDESLIHRYAARMAQEGALLASHAWSSPPLSRVRRLRNWISLVSGLPAPHPPPGPVQDLSTQFFMMKNDARMVDVVMGMSRDDHVKAETAFIDAFEERLPASALLRMTEREPVDPFNRYVCAAQSLYCQHWPARGTAQDPRPWTDPLRVHDRFDGKRETLLKHPGFRRGEHLQRLLNAVDLDYYNAGALRY